MSKYRVSLANGPIAHHHLRETVQTGRGSELRRLAPSRVFRVAVLGIVALIAPPSGSSRGLPPREVVVEDL